MKKLVLLLSYFAVVIGCNVATPNNPSNPPPTVQMTSPAASAILSGNVELAATASDASGIASVQFQIDNQAVGSADTTAPYQLQLDTATLSNGPHTIRAVATNTRNASTVSAVVNVTVDNSTPAPTVSITSPLENDQVSAIIVVTAEASATDGVAAVQFQLDGVDQGLPDAFTPYEFTLDTTGLPNGIHSLTAVVTSTGGLSTTSAPVSILVVNAPTVAITSPALNAVVSGPVTISAIAGAIAGVNNVQFYLDGNAQDLPDDTAPYEISLDTAALANGSHTVSAVVTSNDNLTATSADVSFTVTNLPVIAITNPANNSAASGLIAVSASASAIAGIASVQFVLDGINEGAPLIEGINAPPYEITLDTTLLTNGSHILTAIVTSTDNLTATSAPISINVSNLPTIAISSPADSSTQSGTVVVTASANAIGGIASVQFKLDGSDYLAADTSEPYEVSLDTTLLSNGAHVLTAVVNSLDSLTATSAPVTINVTNQPTISITSPSDNSAASGSIQVTAEANAIGGIANVQFLVDGNNAGSAISGPLYQIALDTTLLADGAHILTAVVNSVDSLTATSAPVTINVSNVAPITNLIRNPSVEDIDPNDPTLPQYWKYTAWGTNDGAATYLAEGRTGNHSLKVEVTSYTDGASNWYPDEIAVTPKKSYKFSDYYKSDVQTHVDVQVTLSDNNMEYLHLGDPDASPTEWTKFEAEFEVPENAVSVTIIHTLTSVGTLTTDDYSLTQIPDLNNAIVSLTFDDSFVDFYANALPRLQTYGFSSTAYVISEVLDGFPDYMTASEIQQVHSLGHEIGSHTVSHPDLTTLSPSELDSELKDSQIALKALINAEVPNFAAPFGALNPQVVAAAKNYYASIRGVEDGFNTRANFNPDNLLVQNVFSTTANSQVEGWIQEAISSKAWLILVYHHVSDSEPGLYNTLPADLDAHLAYLQTTGVAVKTVQQALDEILPQL